MHCRGCRADLPMCSIAEDLELVSRVSHVMKEHRADGLMGLAGFSYPQRRSQVPELRKGSVSGGHGHSGRGPYSRAHQQVLREYDCLLGLRGQDEDDERIWASMRLDGYVPRGDATTCECDHQALSRSHSAYPLPSVLQYSDSQLYNQLLYLASIFDTEKALEVSRGTPRAGTYRSCRPAGRSETHDV